MREDYWEDVGVIEDAVDFENFIHLCYSRLLALRNIVYKSLKF